MQARVRPMTLHDYPEVLALWRRTEGMGLGESDSPASLGRFLAHNADLSPVALTPEGTIVGAVLCGHDGRRGALYHLAVDAAQRERGIARLLVDYCLARLAALGIHKCNVFLFRDNAAGKEFWVREGWNAREDLVLLQKKVEDR